MARTVVGEPSWIVLRECPQLFLLNVLNAQPDDHLFICCLLFIYCFCLLCANKLSYLNPKASMDYPMNRKHSIYETTD